MTSKPPRRRSRKDPAVTLAERLSRFARRLDPEERRVLEAMLVMAMDPLDRQSRRLTAALTDDEAKTVARLRHDD